MHDSKFKLIIALWALKKTKQPKSSKSKPTNNVKKKKVIRVTLLKAMFTGLH